MRTRCVLIVTAAFALLTGLSACSDDEPEAGGQTPTLPTQALPTSNAPAPGLPHSGAPKVETPIADTSAWEADPCTMITDEQLRGIGLEAVTPQREDVPDLGPGCVWEMDSDEYVAVSNGLSTVNREGLSTPYKNNEAGAMQVFEEIPAIEGHPAVIAEAEDLRSEGECGVAVGLRDDLALTIAVQADVDSEQGKDPCGWAVKLATAAVQTMKGSA